MTDEIATGLTHASVVSVAGQGLLIIGPSGCGKSGLALQLLALGAELVADDQTLLSVTEHGVTARPPDALAGQIEARKMGMLQAGYCASTPVVAVVDLGTDEPDRLPAQRQVSIGTQKVDLIHGAGIPNLASALIVRLKGRRLH